MIKINLVSEGRKPVVARKAKDALGAGDTSLTEILAVVLALVGTAATAGYWYILKRDEDRLKENIRVAEETVKELELVLKEVEDFKRKKAELVHKITVIKSLKAAQRGPVLILDQISNGLPELVWLASLELRGKSIVVRGTAFNTNQVATFIENIDRMPEFSEPRLQETARTRGGAYGFSLQFDYLAPPPPELPGGAEPAATGG